MKNKPILPPTYLLIAIVIMVALHFIFPAAIIIRMPWNLLGVIPLAAGVILNLVADRDFKKHQTTVKPFEEATVLITTGVYRLSRNPMYLGFELILIGVALLLGSLTPLAVVILFPILMEALFIRVEEQMLTQQFGPSWLAYQKEVRRWI
jgi:protein-S-isoprenylcysteine O-methyltransferase Ste14